MFQTLKALAPFLLVFGLPLGGMGTFALLGYRLSSLSGISMTPTIHDGAMMLLNVNIDRYHLANGTIISFAYNSSLSVLHRIIEVCDNTYLTQGDHNSGPDSPINASQVIGVYVLTLW